MTRTPCGPEGQQIAQKLCTETAPSFCRRSYKIEDSEDIAFANAEPARNEATVVLKRCKKRLRLDRA